ncbi:MAG: hypothetical protein ACK5RH_03810, partial [Burkholderiales bacterium]
MSAADTLFSPPLRGATARLADELQAGRVYRREDLARLSNAVDRHLNELVSTGLLKKLAQGLSRIQGQEAEIIVLLNKAPGERAAHVDAQQFALLC